MKRVVPIWILFVLTGISAKAQVLDSVQLFRAETYTSLEEALEYPLAVRKLDLSKQKLDTIPADIFKLKNLQVLILDKNKIKTIPPSIGDLQFLQELSVARNKITDLPGEIGSLRNLVKLNVNRNEISALPKEIGKLEQLRELDMWSNEIETFPYEIKNLKKLKLFDLRVIMITDEEQERLQSLLPHTNIKFSSNCNCN